MNALLDMQALLTERLRHDPRLSMATLAAWLDPLTVLEIDPDTDYGYDDDYLTFALIVCRRCFPTAYAQAIAYQNSGLPSRTLEVRLYEAINVHLVAKLVSLEEIVNGVPVEGMGIRLDDPDWFTENPRLVTVLNMFGITRPDDPTCNTARQIGELVAKAYTADRDPVSIQIAHLLQWLFGCSGNTLVDWSAQDLWESSFETFDWTLDDIEFVNEMTQEALDFLTDAEHALTALETNADLRALLEARIAQLTTQSTRKGKRRGTRSQ